MTFYCIDRNSEHYGKKILAVMERPRLILEDGTELFQYQEMESGKIVPLEAKQLSPYPPKKEEN